ncbi:DUF72 domain-containing protein [Rhizobium sp. NTR19]|uniref:DUF72 domain-containing protein n=1 Tax=Neorhizobium turbinariae TaxID=2937795 RepID=A0ABT0ILM3_9HYPH|nr:DUF72 domain-containing protein [Neorhizobium turbinariae]MCK8778780.1 DUF72 domain-containing protein [Neorhizobium turbinariae]
MPIVATAAWSIPKTVADKFPAEGNGLSRYACVFNGVEINTTFYRRHKPATFARWAESVPEAFRFAVKMPKEISHVRRLEEIAEPFGTFLEDIVPLGPKLGPLLCQLPPSLSFDEDRVTRSLEMMRAHHDGQIVIEARHKSWASQEALSLLEHHKIGRVLADPALVWPRASFTGDVPYLRLHGAPKIYYSSYSDEEIRDYAALLGKNSWCVFDNTASGAAIENALTMLTVLERDGQR